MIPLNKTSKCWHDVAMGLRSAYWAMHRHADACLARRGVTANQFVLLALLVEKDGVTQQELVGRAASDPSTIRAMLVLLEQRRLISRTKHPADGRAIHVRLTAKGRREYRQLWTDTQSVRRRLLEALRPGETEVLPEAFARIADTMRPRVSKSSRAKKSKITAGKK